MTPELWDLLMRSARMRAHVYRERSLVSAIRLTERAAARRGTSWAYAVSKSPRTP